MEGTAAFFYAFRWADPSGPGSSRYIANEIPAGTASAVRTHKRSGEDRFPPFRAAITSAADEAVEASFEAAGELLQTQSRTGLVVLRPQAGRQLGTLQG